MPRKRPTINADTLGRPDVHPTDYVAQYLFSKASNHWFMKMPCVDTPGEDLESFYIDRKAEYNLLLKYSLMLREEQRDQKKIFSNRIQILQKTLTEMRASFLQLNNFIRDSDEKKKAAMKKINGQIDIQEELKANIAAKKVAVDELKIFRRELEYTTEQYRAYEIVLAKAAKISEKYDSVKEMINRCDAIMLAQDEITQLDDKLFEEIESMRKRMSDIVKQAELIALGLKNALADMGRSYNAASSECLRWEKIYSNARIVVFSNDNDKGRALDGVSGLYRLLCARRNMDPIFLRSEVEKELDFVKDEVELLRDVLAEYNKKHNSGEKTVSSLPAKC